MSQVESRTATDEQAELTGMGERLKEAREFLGLSQEVVAEALDIPRASVSAMENGKRKVSSLELKRLAKLYRRPAQFFLGEETLQAPADKTIEALFRATKELSARDKEQVLSFAQFLQSAGKPARRNDTNAPE